MRFVMIAALLVGCNKETQKKDQSCDSSVYICDTAAFLDQQKAQDQTIDPADGTFIEVVRLPGCANDNTRWEVSVRVHGETNGTARLNMWAHEDGGGYNEQHPLAVIESDGAGGFEEIWVELGHSASPQDYDPGFRTTYVCGEHDINPWMTYGVRIYDINGNLADCAMFSTEDNPDIAIGEIYTEVRDEPNPVFERSQLNTNNCQTWDLPPPPAM